jgi:DNA-binding response OmpR family regulator
MRILIVEDDSCLAQALVAILTKQNYVVDVAADGEVAWELVTVATYDLILLDIVLPKHDGISLCRQLRKEGYKMLILLLTAKDTKTDKVIGLDAGADDYVVKPFDFQELAARIRALLRRGSTSLPPILEWGSLRLDPSSFDVTYADIALHLTAKEFSILVLFLRNNQRTFSRGAIIDQVWGGEEDPPEENTIKSHIKSLRQKLKAAGATYDFIETVYGMGYRLKISPEKDCQKTELEKNSKQQILLATVDKARQDFQAKVGSRIAILEQANNGLKKGTLDAQFRQKAEQEAHKLVGSSGSFGFTKGSRLAEEIENLFQGKTPIDQGQYLHLSNLLRELRRELVYSKQRPNLLLVSNDKQVIEQLVKEATIQEIQVKIVTNSAAARNAILPRSRFAIANLERFHETSLQPDVVLLDLDTVKDSFELLRELYKPTDKSAALEPEIPTLVLTDHDNFTNRVEVAQSGGRGFLQKSMSASQILEQITQVLQRIRITEARIMVVDDDPQVLTVIQQSLEPLGFRLKTLEDSRRFWDMMTEFCPDLLILDVQMPYINGIEICQVVRNDPHWKFLPVLFIVDNLEADIVQQIFAIGADDCMSKPIVGSKLITRILNRLEKIQLYTRL